MTFKDKNNMTTIQNAAKIILTKCLALKKTEKCLIITDENKKLIAKEIFLEALKISKKIDYIEIPVGKINGEEPSKEVTKRMLNYDVIICPTTKSLTHTNARIAASKKGARIVTLPGITEDIMKRCIDVDYKDMKNISTKIGNILDKAKIVRVTTKIGTDITINIKGVKSHGKKGGDFTNKCDYGNLPEGETFLCPNKIGTNGVYVVDASQAGVGKLKKPIKITVKDGFAVNFEGGKESKKLSEILKSIGDKNAYNVAEFGIGTNKKAIITGIVLEDEKVFGSCHIALGKDDSFGGKINVPIHVDGVMNKPTIIVDNKTIMKDGKLLI